MTTRSIHKIKDIALKKGSLKEFREEIINLDKRTYKTLCLNKTKLELILRKDAICRAFQACVLYYNKHCRYINADYKELIKAGSKRGYWDLLKHGFIFAKYTNYRNRQIHLFTQT